ncbi:DUF5994 family protein [Streptomyces sp. NPDC001118]|uniref:DUF5994 family protein n=1 Tax=unclassified Streptomyces TaxID=2593676 RepID=UPI003326FA86
MTSDRLRPPPPAPPLPRLYLAPESTVPRFRDQFVRLRRATTAHAPSTVVLMAPGQGRRDLLVVPPEATGRAAVSLVSAAGPTPEQCDFAS